MRVGHSIGVQESVIGVGGGGTACEYRSVAQYRSAGAG